MAEELAIHKILLTEYERLKEEQKVRIGFRDNLLYVTLAAVIALVTVVAQKHDFRLLLLLPPVTFVLGWTYLTNDEKITAIGRYIRCEIAPRMASLLRNDEVIFGWETVHRIDRRRRSRKTLQLIVDLIPFTVVPSVALISYWEFASLSTWGIIGSVFELSCVLVLAWQLVVYAEI